MHTIRRLLSSLVVLLPCAAAHAATYVVPPDDLLVGKASAIVVARALTSYAEESPKHGIETVTVLSIEDVLKGNLSSGAEIRVRVIGGVLEKRAKVVPGAPRFTDGERVLVFLNQFAEDYAVTDFGLGLFKFETDDTGREVLIRNATEIKGWNTDGTVHHESRRDAARFLTFVRGVARHIPMKGEYTVERRPLVGDAPQKRGLLLPRSNACTPSPCTATQYSLAGFTEGENGYRWNVFPGAVNVNKGNAAPNATNGGTDAINAAFGSWNGDTLSNTNLVLATTTANTDGIEEAADAVNNIVFEKDIVGSLDFACPGGGLLGLGGISNTSGTSMINLEMFNNTTEADVSMNKGVGPCIGVGLTQAQFNSAVTHEVGHTLGFRHADQTRLGTAVCSTQPTYDCSSSAIMTGAVTYGPLQAWDISAVRALYPGPAAPAAPTGVVANATSTSSVTVTWTTLIDATSYEVYRRAPGGAFTLVGSPGGPPFVNSTGLSPDTAYLYRVRAVNAGGPSPDSASDLATTILFADDPLAAGTTLVKAVHLAQLRTAVITVRAQALLGAPAFTDSAMPGVTIKGVHITELRTQLDEAMGALGLTTGGFTDGSLAGVAVKAVHFQQLGDRVK